MIATLNVVPPTSVAMTSAMPSSAARCALPTTPAAGPGLDGEDRDRLRRRGQAAVRLDDQGLAREAGLAERRHELVEVALDDGSDIGVEKGRGTALVFPEHRGDLARERDVRRPASRSRECPAPAAHGRAFLCENRKATATDS